MKIKQLTRGYVSDIDENNALKKKRVREFIFYNNTYPLHYVCRNEKNGIITSWKYFVPIKEKELIPWDGDTTPVVPFTVKHKSSGKSFAVIHTYPEELVFGSGCTCSYTGLKDNFDYIPDRLKPDETLPCGTWRGE